MRVLADESVHGLTIRRLREGGHDVVAVTATASGDADSDVLERAVKLDRFLLTEDTDFGGLVFQRRQAHRGVLLVRLQNEAPDRQAQLVVETLNAHAEQLRESFGVLTSSGLRVRSSL